MCCKSQSTIDILAYKFNLQKRIQKYNGKENRISKNKTNTIKLIQ